ncbi:D-alanyl-D-alanine carboxypeptidase family protein [Microbacterium protaetiae]|uniref:D-alanyl-D-alanine carboxypeptidase family protein n=2 Tax=Microbacterium protaetiae TaxID=2509458 RepID=A0A4P6EGY9_9MICO|nr:D-alanyl-D-alanine carboxypeptidase family protein [Microbacterium protaetiae]
MAAAALLVLAGGGSAVALANAPHGGVAFAESTLTADVTGSRVSPEATDAASAPSSAAPSGASSAPASDSVTLASLSLCETDAFTDALHDGDDAAAIRVAGGADAFRDAVTEGRAPCVSLSDPTHVWVVVDKLRPLEPADYAPSPRSKPTDVRSLDGSGLRSDAARALAALGKAARAAGAGEIALNSGYRSYTTQQGNYGTQKSERGQSGADAVSARPGYSEHQTGLAGDVVPCTGDACGTLDDIAGTTQGDWIVAHAWEYGWVVRYEKGETDVTGYSPEPWHLRYIGTDLAKAYHQGGYHTLEEFFGLPAAPDYAD